MIGLYLALSVRLSERILHLMSTCWLIYGLFCNILRIIVAHIPALANSAALLMRLLAFGYGPNTPHSINH